MINMLKLDFYEMYFNFLFVSPKIKVLEIWTFYLLSKIILHRFGHIKKKFNDFWASKILVTLVLLYIKFLKFRPGNVIQPYSCYTILTSLK